MNQSKRSTNTVRLEPLWLRAFRIFFLFVFVLGNLFQGLSPTRVAQAVGETPMQTYFLSMPENNVRTAFVAIDTGNGDIGNTMVSITSIATTVNSTIIYYDQWEDGYEALSTTPAQTSTLVFGDGNTANGNACTYAEPASLCSADVLTSGAVLVLRNNVPSNPRGTSVTFDARDKLATTQVVAVTRAMWDSDTGTVLAGALQVYDTSGYGNDFRLPVGENISASAMFDYAGLFVMAANDGTTVNIDSDGNGTNDYTTTLAAGQAYFLSSTTSGVTLNSNARITSNLPIQVNLITGDTNSNQKYENRWFNIPPLTLLGTSYVTPVSSMSNSNSNVFIYNPSQTSSITVFAQTSSGTTNFSVAARATYRYVMPTGSGARFYTNNGAVFMSIGTNDSPSVSDTGSSVGSSWDWGYTLIAEEQLAPSLAVGWAPGSNTLPPANNGSPVWVSAAGATTIYVDYDGNPATGPNTDVNGNHYNTSYTVTALQSVRIYDPDNNQTAMRVYTVDGTLLAATWGEDTSVAGPGNPYLDMGYVIFPLPQMVLTKDGVLDVTATTPLDQANAGDVVHYTLKATNNGTRTLTNVTIVDAKLGTLACTPAQPTTLVSGASMTCTGSYTLTQADINAGVVYNSAIGDSNQTPPTTVQEEVKIPLLSVTKTASPTSVPETGGSVTFTFTVKNNNSVASDVSLVILTLSDTVYGTLAGDSDCQVGTVLAPQASCNFSITRTVSGDAELSVNHTNRFTAVAEDAEAGNDPDVSASDNETVTITDVDPAIDIEKFISVDGGTTWLDEDSATGPLVFSGTNPRFQFVVTNTGPVTLNALTLNDANFTSFYQSDLTSACAIPATLAPSASFTCYAQLAWAAGQHTNTATAIGSMTDGAGNYEHAIDSDAANYFGAVPGLSLTKSADPGTYDAVGQTIIYSYVITNTGNYTLSGPFSVTDDKATVSCTQPGDGALSPGETMNCTATYTVAQADLDASLVTNVATATGGGQTSNQATATVYAVPHPGLALDKTVTSSGPYDSVGDMVSYSYQLTNSGNVALFPTYAVTDNKVSVSCPQTPNPLPVGASITCTASYAITQVDLDAGEVANIAQASATFGGNPVLSNQDTEKVTTVQSPALSIDKTASPLIYDAAGNVISYSYLVTNTGNVTLTDPITVSDNKATATCPALPVGGLAPGASITCAASYTILQSDMDAGSVTNVAFASSGMVNSPPDTETVTADQDPNLTLDKSASPATYNAAGQTISYTYVLTNSGDVTLSGPFSVTDDKATVVCPEEVTSLAVNGTLTCTASHIVTQAEVDSGSITNTARAQAFFGGSAVPSNDDTETVTADQNPALAIVKTAGPTTYDYAGDIISYSYLVTNSGNVTLYGISVEDDKADANCPSTAGGLAPGATITCTASYTITQVDMDSGSVTNTAYATDGTTQSTPDSETVNAIQQGGLGLAKSAAPATYDAVGDSITYTYVVENTGNITLAGPFTVNDDKVGAVDCGEGPLAPEHTVTCTAVYTIQQGDLDAGSLTNLATATDGVLTSNEATATVAAIQSPALSIDKTAQEATYAIAGDMIHYSYVVTNSGNITLSGPFTVSDDKAADETCPATASLAPGASITCTASYVIQQSDLDAGELTNVASATNGTVTSPTDTVTIPATQSPGLTLAKSANPLLYSQVDQVITYDYELTNSGNVTLSAPFTVDDDKALVTCPVEVAFLAPGEVLHCTATSTITQNDLDNGTLTNIATAAAVFDGQPVTSNQAQATVTANQNPQLTLVKDTTTANYDEAGDVISYSYTLTNSGNVTLTGPFTVIDNKTTVNCTQPVDGALSPLETMSCTATYTILQSDMDAGSVMNIATGHGFFGTAPVPSNVDSETVPALALPALGLTKSADPLTYDAVDDVIEYTYVLTNIGNVTLIGPFTVTDDKTTVTCPETASLAPDASITCEASYIILQADLDAGSVINTAAGQGFFGETPVNSNNASATVTAIPLPALTIVKTAAPATYDAVGNVITYSFKVTNSGNVTLHTAIVVNDDKATDESCPALPAGGLAPGEYITCTASYAITQEDLDAGSVTNSAYATSGATQSNTDTETVTAEQNPALTIAKSVTETSYDATTDVLHYSYTVTNSGNVTLEGPFTVHDDKATDESCPAAPASLAPGESITCTATYAITQADLDAGSVTNYAYATVVYDGETVTSNTDDATVTADQNPALTLDKEGSFEVGPDGYAAPGELISYSFAVKNTGNITLHNVLVTDPLQGMSTITCEGGSNPIAVLEVGVTRYCSATYPVTQADIDRGYVDNTATANSTETEPVTDDNREELPQLPGLMLEKTVTSSGPYDSVGDLITYQLVATNTGLVTLTNVSISDPLLGTLVCTPEQPATLGPGQTLTCTGSYAVQQGDLNAGFVANTATADSDQTEPDTDDANVSLTQSPALVLDKTVTSSGPYDSVGDVINYQLVATNTGNITLHGVSITDPALGTLVCTPEQPATLAPNETLICTGSHTVDQIDLDAGSYYNIATADSNETGPVTDDVTVPMAQNGALTLDKTGVFDAGADGYADVGELITYEFEITNTGNVTLHNITVTDPLPGLSAIICPQTSLEVGSSMACTATYAVTQADIDAGSVYNLATANSDETEPVEDDNTEPLPQNPAMTVVKSSATTSLSAPATVTYEYLVTNAGNVTLTGIVLSDDNDNNDMSCPATTLEVGESMTCTATHTFTQEELDANGSPVAGTGLLYNIVTADSAQTEPVTDDLSIPISQSAAMTVVKSSTTTSLSEPGTVTYDYLVTNTGNLTLTGIVLSDNNDNDDLVCPFDTLAVGASMTCHATHTFTQEELNAGGTLDNIVTADSAQTEPVTNDLSIPITRTPAMTVEKSSTTTSLSEPGTVTYSYLVTNTGNTTLTGIVVSDNNDEDDMVCESDTLAVGASMTCHATHTFTQDELDANGSPAAGSGVLYNVVTADSTQTEPVTDDLSIPITQNAGISLAKTGTFNAGEDNFANVGELISYEFLITNTGNTTLTGIAVTDPLVSLIDCPATELPVGESMTCTATYAVTQADIDAGSVYNLATADSEETEPVTDDNTQPLPQNPAIQIIKGPELQKVDEGATVTFDITVTNTGNVSLTNVDVTDALAPDCNRSDLNLAVGESFTYTCTVVANADFTNVAVVTGSGPQQQPVTDDDDAVVDVLPTIAVSKLADPAAVDEPGADVTFTINVLNTSPEDVTLTSLVDDIYGDLDGVGTCDVPVTIAAGATYSCAFTQFVSGNAGSSHTNIVSGTANDNEGNPAGDTGTATVTVSGVAPVVDLVKEVDPASMFEPGGAFTYTLTITNNSVEPVTITALTDTNALSPECTALIDVELPVGGSTSCTYTVTQTEAGTYQNTAEVTVTDNDGETATASDNASVKVFDVPPTVALDKSVVPAELPEPGGLFTYTLTITNESVEAVTITALTDSYTLPEECTALIGTSLAAGASTSCNYSLNYTEAGSYDNTANVVVADNEGNEANASDSETVTVTPVAPVVMLQKAVNPDSMPEPGGLFTYTLQITNTSVEPVNITALSDTNTLSQDCLDLIGDSLAVDQTVSCQYTATWTEAGAYPNTASVTVTDNDGQTASDTAQATATVTDVLPSVMLDKQVDIETLPEPGGVFTYTLLITNTSVEPVTITALSDSNALSPECQALVGDVLPVDGTASCTYAVTRTDDGLYSNTANVTVADNEGNTASADDTVVVTVTDALPNVSLEKTAEPLTMAEPGGSFIFTLLITNHSAEPVTITALVDTNPLPAGCTSLIGTVLAANGGFAACSYPVTYTEPGVYNNEASVSVVDDDNNTDSATDTASVSVTDVLPTVTLVKTASPLTLPEPGGVFTYTLEITNTSVEPVVIDLLTDTNPLSEECLALAGMTLAVGQTVSCNYTAIFTDAGVYPNTASVTVSDNDGNSASASDDATVEVTNTTPVIEVTKTADPISVPETGGDVTFTFLVENLSVEPVELTELTDNVFGNLDGQGTCDLPQTIAVGGEYSCAITVPLASDTLTAHTNEVTAKAFDNEGDQATATDDETVTFTDVAPTIMVTKTANPTSVPETGGLVQFTFVVENTGTEAVTITGLNDSVFGELDGDDDCEVGSVLPVDGSCTFSITRWVEGDFGAADHVNVFTAAAVDNDGTPASDDDDATVSFNDVAPAITVTKTADPTHVPETGDSVTFTFVVENTGPEDVTLTALTDTLFGDLDGKGSCVTGGLIPVGGSYTCTYTVFLSSDSLTAHTNVVTAVGTDDDGTTASDDDDATVTFDDVAPWIRITKWADKTSIPETGANVTFTFRFENIGEEDVTLTSLTDTMFDDLNGKGTCVLPQEILIGGSYSCTYTLFLASDSLAAHYNLVTATAVDDDNVTATDDDDETVTFTDVAPAVVVTKTASPTHVPETGGDVTFTFVVQNTGVEDVTLTVLTDTVFGDLDGMGTCEVPQTILVGASYSCAYTVFLASDSLADHYNVTSVTVVDDDDTPATDDDDETVTFDDVAPMIEVTKTANPTTVPETGGNVTFTFLVENIGQEDVTLTELTDTMFGDLDGKGTCAVPQTILIGGEYSCTYTVFLASDTLASHKNVVTATAVDDDGTTATDDDQEMVTFTDVKPMIEVTKTASPAVVPETGADVTFTFLVDNTGQEEVTLTTLSDTVFGDLNAQGTCVLPQIIAVNGSYECAVTVFLSSDSLTAHYNVTTASAVDDDGSPATDSDDETVTFTDVAPSITVTKTADPISVPETGGQVTFTFVVTNDGVEDVTLTSLTDSMFGDLNGQGDCVTGGLIPVGGSYTCAVTKLLSSDSLTAHTNVVTAVGTDEDGTTDTATDDETVTFTDVAPTIMVTKTANPTSVPETGGLVAFTFVVENTGTELVTITGLNDSVFGELEGDDDCEVGSVLPVDGSCTFSITRWVEGDFGAADHVNVFTAAAVDNDGTPASDDDDATVSFNDVAPAITVTKTADPTHVPETGGSVTFTFVVENTGPEDVTLTAVTDTLFGDLDGKGSCVTGGLISVGGSYTCTYTVFLSSDSLTAHTNVVTAVGTDDDGTTASDDDDATVTFDDVAPMIRITKTADKTSIPETGGNVTFTFLVENIGPEDVTLTALTDTVFGNLDGKGTCDVPQTILIGGSYTCEYTVFLASDSLTDHTNVVTADAVDDDNTPATATDDETITFTDVAPAVMVMKTADPTHVPETGGDVTFTFVVENTGQEDVTLTVLTDTVFGDLDGMGTCEVLQTIAIGESYTCSITVFLASDSLADHYNVTSVTVVDDDNTPATDDDDETVTFDDVAPMIEVTKTASPTSVPETGADVTFTFLVENTGAEDVTLTELTDTMFGDLNGKGTCAVPQTILVGGEYSCTYTIFLASDTLASHKNVVTATAVDDDGTTATDDDQEMVSFTDVAPDISVTKTADPTHVPETGGNVTFTFVVTNDGVEDVTLTSLVDDVFGDLNEQGSCVTGDLIPVGGSYTCSITVFLASDSLMAHDNLVTAVGTDDDGTTDTATDDATVTFDDVAPSVMVTKTADPTVLPETGGNVTFTFVVTNDGVEDVTLTSLTDSMFGDLNGQGDCVTGGLIPVGGSYTCAVTKFLSSDSLTAHTNVVTAVGTDDDGTSDTATDDETVTFTDVAPVIMVTKTASPTHVPETGGNVTFTFLVENTGVEDVTLTALTDTVFGDLNGQGTCTVPQTIAIGDSYSCTITVFMVSDSLTAHTNVATATAVDDDGTPASDDDDATVTFDDVAPTIDVTKTASPVTVPETGGDVTFTFLVENTGAEDVTLTELTDSIFGNLDGKGTCAVPQTILIGGIYTCEYTVLLTSDSLTAHKNVVTASAVDDDGTTASDKDDETVTFTDVAPAIMVTKTADPISVPETGGDVTFTFVVENTGQEDVTLTSLVDDAFGDLNGQGDCAVPQTILIGEAYTCTVTKFLSSDSLTAHKNVVTASAVDDDGTTASDKDDETVTFTDVAPAIMVTKTADKTSIPETGADVTFTFVVQNIGPEDVLLNGLTDNIFGDLDGKGTCDLPQAILISGSYTCTYTVFLASDSLTAHTNLVTANAVDDDGTPAVDFDDETVTFTDVAPMIQITKTASPTHVPETGGNVTFTFLVENTGQEDVTLTTLTDTVFGGLNGLGTCSVPQTIAIGGQYSCTISVFLASDSLTAHTNVATATAVDDDDTPASDDDDATVTFDDVAPAIMVTKTADKTSIPETGADVTFTFVVENTGLEDVALTVLTDTIFGDLDGKGTCGVPQTILIGGSYTCTYTVFLTSDSLAAHKNVVTATAVDDDNTPATATDDETVTFTDVLPDISVTKTADDTSIPETGADVTFTFVVTNHSLEAVTISSLNDSAYGALAGDDDCKVGTVLAGGASCEFSITRFISGDYPGSHYNKVTVKANDNDGNTDTATDDETVVYEDALPDISVIKTANPEVVPEIYANVTFTFKVINNSSEPVKITYLYDSKFGVLTGDSDCKVGTVLAGGASCEFSLTKMLKGDAATNATHTNLFTARGEDDEGNMDEASDDATVTFTDVMPSIDVNKTANPTKISYPGANVKFMVTVKNTGVEPLGLFTLVDDVYGNLNGVGTCRVPQVIAVGATYMCTFTKYVPVTLEPFETGYHKNTVTGTGVDNEYNEVSDSGTAIVTFYWRGRTPGYWKNHTSSWPKFSIVNYLGKTVSITTSTPVLSVFSVPKSLQKCTTTCILDLDGNKKNDTLLNALVYKGGDTLAGKAQILLRAATAALLNERYFGATYPPYGSVTELINAVNATLATLDEAKYVAMAAELDWWNNGVE